MSKSFFKTIILTLIITLSFSLTGCSKNKIDENVFQFTWKKFITKQFEDSFDEKQSKEQQLKSLNEITDELKIDYNDFLVYMKSKHPNKYNKLMSKSKE